ncbi:MULTISPECIES: STY4199 family HEPN domain-containing protein [Enterobacterales]|uniref:STY4199 family HEPN domain-containing protein n=1 Tax=Enterobacterales TaxID=91347 RepID=UPI002EDA2617
MHIASHYSGDQFEHCLGVVRQAATEILSLLNVHTSEAKDPRWFLEQLEQARLNLGGWAAVARKLNLNDAELSDFTVQLRHLQQVVPVYERGQAVSENQLIAALRFVAVLEAVREKQPLLKFASIAGDDSNARQEQAQRQMRALTLTLKALISQAWPDSTKLNNHLKLQFGADSVRRWLANSDAGDILSGMLFSDLASLVVDKKAFARHYSPLFNSASALTFLAEQRVTLHAFLEDCRGMRNAMVARRPLTTTEIALLDNFTHQIAGPVQRAFEQGRTRVNPAAFMAVDSNELHHFWEDARTKDRALGGDHLPVRDNIEPPKKQEKRTPEDREQLISTILWGTVGVVVLVMAFASLWLFSNTTPAESASQPETQALIDAPEREIPSPREKLANMGISWDVNSLRAAIDRNDTRVTTLFLQGGMTWQLAWTEQAHSFRYDEVLELLLRYRLQMDEPKPCRRFMTTLGHAMANGESLTSVRKSYLQAFCTTPAVVERQRYNVSQAKLRADASPDVQNKKWLTIQSAIYDAIR